MITLEDVMKYLNDCESLDEISAINSLVLLRYNNIRQIKRNEFKIGERVWFTNDKGERTEGMITSIKRKKMKILVIEKIKRKMWLSDKAKFGMKDVDTKVIWTVPILQVNKICTKNTE